MLLTSKARLSLPPNRKVKVHKVCIAFEQTFVLFCSNSQSETEHKDLSFPSSIIHINNNNKVVKQYELGINVAAIEMTDDYTAVACLPKQGKIVLIDLKQKVKKHIDYPFMDNIRSIYMFIFNESKLLCLVEVTHDPKQYEINKYQIKKCDDIKETWLKNMMKNRKQFNDKCAINKIKMTYFKNHYFYEPILTYTLENKPNKQEQTYQQWYYDTIKQSNEHSMLSVGIKPTKEQIKKVFVHQLSQIEGKLSSKTFLNKLPNFNSGCKSSFDLWQVYGDIFAYVMPTDMNMEIGIINAKENFRRQLTNLYDKILINWPVYFMKEYLFFRQSYFLANQTNHSTYSFNFLHLKKEQFQVLQQSPNYWQVHDYLCPYDRNIINEHTHDQPNNVVNVVVRKIVEIRDLMMHMLLHLNEDFDDDLLMEAIDLF